MLDPSLLSTIGGKNEKAKTDFVQFCGGYVFFLLLKYACQLCGS